MLGCNVALLVGAVLLLLGADSTVSRLIAVGLALSASLSAHQMNPPLVVWDALCRHALNGALLMAWSPVSPHST